MKGSVYAIRSHQTKDIYIGSTKETLSRRMAGHRRQYKSYINGNPDYITSFEVIQYEDAYIELIELIEYNDKSELIAREGHYIRTMDCVNKVIPDRTKKEGNKDYYEKNIDKIKIIQKVYRENNKEQSKKYNIEYRENNKEHLQEKAKKWRIDNIAELTKKITCECGSICSKRGIPKHKRTKTHIKFIQDFA